MANHADTTYFRCLYEDPYPIGNFGGRTFYSVMRAVGWRDETLLPLKLPKALDFCFIWHQIPRHDLVQIAETIYMTGLLSPVRFIGARENTISLLISSKFRAECGAVEFEQYQTDVEKTCCETLRTKKEFSIGVFDCSPDWPAHEIDLAGIIPANEYRVSTYLRNIDNLWQLGLKPFTPTPEFRFK
jgi:hypothetical protein